MAGAVGTPSSVSHCRAQIQLSQSIQFSVVELPGSPVPELCGHPRKPWHREVRMPTVPSAQLLAPSACLLFQGRLFHISIFPVGGTTRDRLCLPLFMDVIRSMSYFVFVFF